VGRYSKQKPLLLLEKYAEKVQALHARLEPVKNRINTGDLEALYAKNPAWGGIVNNVRTIMQRQTEHICIPDLALPQV